MKNTGLNKTKRIILRRSPLYTFVDLFAGIGGMRLAFEEAGGRCVFSSEWNKFCQVTYEANFDEKPHGDIQKIETHIIPDHDILVAGFPCQPFSIAGVSKNLSLGRKHGFEHEKQGNLFFEIARILQQKQPKVLLLENVKNLKSHDKGKTYAIIKGTLERLRYTIFAEICDAKHYVPQHRERIIIVGFKNDLYPAVHFHYPEPPENRLINLSDILEKNVPDKYTLSDGLWQYLKSHAAKHRAKGNGFGYGLIDTKMDTVTRTLSARYYKDGSEILIKQKGKNPRKLTPRECARLMGFNDNFSIPVSNAQAYRQFGNALCVPLLTAIAKQIMNTMKEYND